MDAVQARESPSDPVVLHVVPAAAIRAQSPPAHVMETLPNLFVRPPPARVASVPIGVLLSAATRSRQATIEAPVTTME